jgi:hypothetical protein
MSGNSIISPPLPHSLEAERAILGAILLGGSGTDEAITTIQALDFFILRHQVIFRIMKELREAGLPTNDAVLLYEALRTRGELEAAGGIAYISQLPEELPRPRHLAHYIEIVLQKSRLRARVLIAEMIRDKALNASGNAADVLREISILSAPLREEVGQRRKLKFMSGAELAAATDKKVEWIVPGYVACGAITEIGAQVKAGKTTLIAAIVHAAAEGADFLGRPTLKTATVYLTEQPSVSFRQTTERAGLLGRSDFHILSHSEIPQMPWPEVAAAAVDECERVGARFLVIDTLPQFAGLPGDAENNSGDALEAMKPLQRAAGRGLAVVAVRHDRKAGGDVGESGRGSTAFAAVSDIVISLRNGPGPANTNVRVLKAKSRFSQTPPELVIELTENGYIALGNSAAGALKAAKDAIVAVAPNSETEAIAVEELTNIVALPRTTVQRGLTELVAEGRLIKIGYGKKSSKLRYFLSENHICPTSFIKGQEESKTDRDLGGPV